MIIELLLRQRGCSAPSIAESATRWRFSPRKEWRGLTVVAMRGATAQACLNGANFTGAKLVNASIGATNFTNVDLTQTDPTGASWSDTIGPDLSNSDKDGKMCVGHLQP
jgi:uncharacterized protein YjbI with pentapeptide repeats